MHQLFTGCQWAEGPAWFGGGRYLVWSDIPDNRMMRYDETDGSVSVFRQPSGNSNGNTVDRQGRLITCEHGGRRVSRTEHDGTVITLADRFEGKRLNSPNDVVVKSDGSIWFTDPSYGIDTDYEGNKAESEIGRCNVYRIDPQSGRGHRGDHRHGAAQRARLLARRERCSMSPTPGARTSGSTRPHIRVFEVKGDRVSGGRQCSRTATAGLFDGFRLDTDGRIWTSAGDGVHCYDAGRHADRQDPGARGRRQFCFGGSKRNVLYICATTSLYAVRLMVNGAKTY